MFELFFFLILWTERTRPPEPRPAKIEFVGPPICKRDKAGNCLPPDTVAAKREANGK